MRNLRNPKWLFIINTVPITILFFLYSSEYNIIKSLLDKETINLWQRFGLTLAFLGILNAGYALVLTFKKQTVPFWYGILALLLYIPFIYLHAYHSDSIIPSSIPQWMVPGNIILYVGTFLMPTLVHALFLLVSHFTPVASEHKAWKNFVIAIAIPIAWYFFSQILLPLWRPVDGNLGIHTMIIFIIIGTLAFLFFVIRGIFILITKKSGAWQQYQLVWKIPISILLPIIGLAVNNGHLFRAYYSSSSGIFGDFGSKWFYILAIVNGFFICLPNVENKLYRLLLFIGRSITFAYTFYFFLVFLPFLPLSVLAIAAIGTGFLMLTPLLLFILHVIELNKDVAFLKNHFSKKTIWTSFLGVLALPIFITTTYLKDKAVLNETLNYLYNPDYSKPHSIDTSSLQNTLEVVQHHKDRNSDFFLGDKMPYLSSYYNWLVLDNLTLSDAKINTIERIFFGAASFNLREENIRNEEVKISNISSTSSFDKTQNAWKSWVDIEITNNSENNLSEYATTINLPEGAWISDYYLYVGNKKEMGILAEKKSAMWVFSNIRNQNRDPGILYYSTGNKVAFRVFPFTSKEVRKTGFEILHKEPIDFTIDNHKLKLGNETETVTTQNKATEKVVYVSAKQKQSLRPVKRKPYFHFLVDVSKNKNKLSTDFIKNIEAATTSYPNLAENAQISFVNSYVNTIPLRDNWKETYKKQNFEAGFYLDRAIRSALVKTYNQQPSTYPVFVVLTDDSLQQAVLDKDFADLKMAFPENDYFFNLKQNGKLEPHSLVSNPAKQLADSIQFSFNNAVLAYNNNNKTVYLPNNNQASIVLKEEIFEVNLDEIKEKSWQSALVMQGKWMSQILHPEISNKEWLNLVKYSFISKTMSPVTSYLVVENEAQKAILKKKQEQVLSGNKSLDLDEDTQRMSEPSFWIVLALLGLVIWRRQKKRLHLMG
jgi:hypothetical protein